MAAVSRERAAVENMSSPDPDELDRLVAAEERIAERLRAALAEREALPEAAASPTAPLDPQQRLEAALVEQRIDSLVSRRIEADRLEVSE
jgi:hypothetical protein